MRSRVVSCQFRSRFIENRATNRHVFFYIFIKSNIYNDFRINWIDVWQTRIKSMGKLSFSSFYSNFSSKISNFIFCWPFAFGSVDVHSIVTEKSKQFHRSMSSHPYRKRQVPANGEKQPKMQRINLVQVHRKKRQRRGRVFTVKENEKRKS